MTFSGKEYICYKYNNKKIIFSPSVSVKLFSSRNSALFSPLQYALGCQVGDTFVPRDKIKLKGGEGGRGGRHYIAVNFFKCDIREFLQTLGAHSPRHIPIRFHAEATKLQTLAESGEKIMVTCCRQNSR